MARAPEVESEPMAAADQKMSKLEVLLEKAGAYSSFLYEQLQVEGSDLPVKKKQKRTLTQPTLLSGGSLRPYQLEGVEWLCNLFENGIHGILADEMGLGKTVQVIGLIAKLTELKVKGSYLIVAPLSTLRNWENEVHKWAPTLDCYVYHGRKAERRKIRKELPKHPIIITSYEMILSDFTQFKKIKWKYVIVDEGHRMKNRNCLLTKKMHLLSSENRLLLTGTPLQNTLSELWSLLHFILPDVFDDLELFESWFELDEETLKLQETKQKAHVVRTLHEILRPFVLRRLKTHVTKDLPLKKEIVVYAPMTEMQQEFSRLILTKQTADFPVRTIRNRCMQLRKACNHPFLLYPPENDVTLDEIVSCCGKLQVLAKMLTKLQAQGDRVLLFSQMTKVLDILQEFLDLAGYSCARIDGNTSLQSRVDQMEAFQQPDGPFCFLLSTRAAGLGLNLTAANTVILYDSDWNPQQDNQAQDRAHRIGQVSPVIVYRLVSSNSFENRMLEKINSKKKLERVVIQRGDFKNAGVSSSAALEPEEFEALLRDDVEIRSNSDVLTDAELEMIVDRKNVFSSTFPTSGKGYDCVDVSLTASLMGTIEE